MNLKACLPLCAAALLSLPASGALVETPWAPVTGNANEKNLYDILGFADNATMNTAILNQSAGAFTDFTVSTSDSAKYSSLLIELAGNASFNEFGIYKLGSTASTDKLTIFNGSASPDWSVLGAKQIQVTTIGPNTFISVVGGGGSINIGSDTAFGFYLNTYGSSGIFYSQISLNGDGKQHVAALDVLDTKFGQPPFAGVLDGQAGYIMGWEDLPIGSPNPSPSDVDYQDLVVSLTAVPIPEPTTVIAGALLLLPFGASTVRFLRKNRSA